MADRWIKRWKVPSSSSPNTEYTVAQDKAGQYGCSCPRWTKGLYRRQDCHHIKAVKAGRYDPDTPAKSIEPQIVLANVRGVIPKVEDDGQTVRQILTPLIPIGDTHFEATVVYNLLAAGVSWSTLKARYSVARVNPKYKIIRFIEENGCRIYGPWDDTRRRYEGFEIVEPLASPRS